MNTFKRWLVIKLGGYYLDEEERALLFPLWFKRIKESHKKFLDQQATQMFFHGFTTTYTKDK